MLGGVFTLGNGQAIVMRFDPTDQDVVAVDDQVMGCNRRAQITPACTGIIHTILCGDMFHDHAQLWDCTAQWVQNRLQ